MAISSAEVTVVYATICLWTGMLWGRVAWGIWWTWDARLTSMLLLWLLYVSYLMLRKLSSTGQTQTLAAVLSVFAGDRCAHRLYVDPLVADAASRARLWRRRAIRDIDPSMKPAFWMERPRLGDVGHLDPRLPLHAGTPPAGR